MEGGRCWLVLVGAGGDKKLEVVVVQGREPGAATGASFPQPSSRLHTHAYTFSHTHSHMHPMTCGNTQAADTHTHTQGTATVG